MRVEWRLDGSIGVRHRERYLTVELCTPARKPEAVQPKVAATRKNTKRDSDWNKNFDLHTAPPLWQAAKTSGYKRGATD